VREGAWMNTVTRGGVVGALGGTPAILAWTAAGLGYVADPHLTAEVDPLTWSMYAAGGWYVLLIVIFGGWWGLLFLAAMS